MIGPEVTRKALDGYASYLNRSADHIMRDLVVFVELVQKWQNVQNLVSRETLTDLWGRHVLDSLQLLPLVGQVESSTNSRFIDFGSGGGFPAIPMAICLKSDVSGCLPSPKIHMIDSNQRKISFLRTVRRNLDLNMEAHAARFDEVSVNDIGIPDLITCRATAELDTLFGHIHPFWGECTMALLHKGADYRAEVSKCHAHWSFDMIVCPSETDAQGVILKISHLRRKSL